MYDRNQLGERNMKKTMTMNLEEIMDYLSEIKLDSVEETLEYLDDPKNFYACNVSLQEFMDEKEIDKKTLVEIMTAQDPRPDKTENTKKAYRKKINEWLNGSAPTHETLMQVCFALQLSEEEALVLIQNVRGLWGFNYRNPKEIIANYCLVNHMPYGMIDHIYQIYENKTVDIEAESDFTKATATLRDYFSHENWKDKSEEEFIDALCENKKNFLTFSLSVVRQTKELHRNLLTVLIDKEMKMLDSDDELLKEFGSTIEEDYEDEEDIVALIENLNKNFGKSAEGTWKRMIAVMKEFANKNPEHEDRILELRDQMIDEELSEVWTEEEHYCKENWDSVLKNIEKEKLWCDEEGFDNKESFIQKIIPEDALERTLLYGKWEGQVDRDTDKKDISRGARRSTDTIEGYGSLFNQFPCPDYYYRICANAKTKELEIAHDKNIESETVRKQIIMYYFLYFLLRMNETDENDEENPHHYTFDVFVNGMNMILDTCAFGELDPKSPYDFLLLYTIYTYALDEYEDYKEVPENGVGNAIQFFNMVIDRAYNK